MNPELLHCVVCAAPIAVVFDSPSIAIGDSFSKEKTDQLNEQLNEQYCPGCALSIFELTKVIENGFSNENNKKIKNIYLKSDLKNDFNLSSFVWYYESGTPRYNFIKNLKYFINLLDTGDTT